MIDIEATPDHCACICPDGCAVTRADHVDAVAGFRRTADRHHMVWAEICQRRRLAHRRRETARG